MSKILQTDHMFSYVHMFSSCHFLGFLSVLYLVQMYTNTNPTQASLQFTVSFFVSTPKYQSQQILSKHSNIPSQATNHNNSCFQNTKFAKNLTNVNT